MKQIIAQIREEENMGHVRGGLIFMINASLIVLEKAANEVKDNENIERKELVKSINNYRSLHGLAENFLSEQELNEINRRYGELQEIWAPGYN
jgi:myo-inositol catabolism protein IolC